MHRLHSTLYYLLWYSSQIAHQFLIRLLFIAHARIESMNNSQGHVSAMAIPELLPGASTVFDQ